MTKVLNLDNLADVSRELVLGGRTYAVRGMTVAGFIAITKAAEKLNDSSTFSEQVEATIDTIRLGIPDITHDVLTSLTMEQMKAVLEFVRGETPEGAAPEAGEDAKKE